MKLLHVLLAIFSLTFLSCEKNAELNYTKEERKINIWLGTATVAADSLTYNFAYNVPGRDSLMFNYRIAGYPFDQDVQFELQAVSGDTNRVNYSLGKYIIRAGEYQGTAPIYIDKPSGYSEFKNSAGKIVFKLKSSEVYAEGAKELSALNVVFRNYVAKPDNWDAAVYPYFALSRYFGTYSNVKYGFVIQTTGMIDFKVYYTVANNPELEVNTITATQASALQNQCKVALQAYNEHNPVLVDENNIPVVFP